MNIYILRHGIAVERGTKGIEKDSDRPLTAKGKRQLKKSAAAMRKMKLRFDLILSSPYERARRTAEIVAGILKLRKRLKFTDVLRYEGEPETLISQIAGLKPMPGNLLLVGHEPYLSRLASHLISGSEAEKLGMGKCARLEWLLTSKQMKAMA
jgi:phosphohistidine phosphatase